MVFVLSALLSAACHKPKDTPVKPAATPLAAAKISISPAPGKYPLPLELKLSSNIRGARIRYAIDKKPSAAKGSPAPVLIRLLNAGVVYAIADVPGHVSSRVHAFAYAAVAPSDGESAGSCYIDMPAEVIKAGTGSATILFAFSSELSQLELQIDAGNWQKLAVLTDTNETPYSLASLGNGAHELRCRVIPSQSSTVLQPYLSPPSLVTVDGLAPELAWVSPNSSPLRRANLPVQFLVQASDLHGVSGVLFCAALNGPCLPAAELSSGVFGYGRPFTYAQDFASQIVAKATDTLGNQSVAYLNWSVQLATQAPAARLVTATTASLLTPQGAHADLTAWLDAFGAPLGATVGVEAGYQEAYARWDEDGLVAVDIYRWGRHVTLPPKICPTCSDQWLVFSYPGLGGPTPFGATLVAGLEGTSFSAPGVNPASYFFVKDENSDGTWGDGESAYLPALAPGAQAPGWYDSDATTMVPNFSVAATFSISCPECAGIEKLWGYWRQSTLAGTHTLLGQGPIAYPLSATLAVESPTEDAPLVLCGFYADTNGNGVADAGEPRHEDSCGTSNVTLASRSAPALAVNALSGAAFEITGMRYGGTATAWVEISAGGTTVWREPKIFFDQAATGTVQGASGLPISFSITAYSLGETATRQIAVTPLSGGVAVSGSINDGAAMPLAALVQVGTDQGTSVLASDAAGGFAGTVPGTALSYMIPLRHGYTGKLYTGAATGAALRLDGSATANVLQGFVTAGTWGPVTGATVRMNGATGIALAMTDFQGYYSIASTDASVFITITLPAEFPTAQPQYSYNHTFSGAAETADFSIPLHTNVLLGYLEPGSNWLAGDGSGGWRAVPLVEISTYGLPVTDALGISHAYWTDGGSTFWQRDFIPWGESVGTGFSIPITQVSKYVFSGVLQASPAFVRGGESFTGAQPAFFGPAGLWEFVTDSQYSRWTWGFGVTQPIDITTELTPCDFIFIGTGGLLYPGKVRLVDLLFGSQVEVDGFSTGVLLAPGLYAAETTAGASFEKDGVPWLLTLTPQASCSDSAQLP